MPPESVTEATVILREFDGRDAGRLLEAFRDPEYARWGHGPATEDDVIAWMRERNDWSVGDRRSWAVSDPADDLLGSVSLRHIDTDQGDAEAGYWVAPWARRRGIATAALRAAVGHAFDDLGLRRVYLYHAVDNPASCGVARAAGFRLEGTLLQSHRYGDGAFHDEHLHAVLAGEWRRTGIA